MRLGGEPGRAGSPPTLHTEPRGAAHAVAWERVLDQLSRHLATCAFVTVEGEARPVQGTVCAV